MAEGYIESTWSQVGERNEGDACILDAQSSLHTTCVNIVKWDGLARSIPPAAIRRSDTKQGRPLHTLKDHAHWVTTLALNTDFVLHIGPYNHTGNKPPLTKTISLPLSYQASPLTPPFPYSPKIRINAVHHPPLHLPHRAAHLQLRVLHQTHHPTNMLPAPSLPRRFAPGRSVGSVSCLG